MPGRAPPLSTGARCRHQLPVQRNTRLWWAKLRDRFADVLRIPQFECRGVVVPAVRRFVPIPRFELWCVAMLCASGLRRSAYRRWRRASRLLSPFRVRRGYEPVRLRDHVQDGGGLRQFDLQVRVAVRGHDGGSESGLRRRVVLYGLSHRGVRSRCGLRGRRSGQHLHAGPGRRRGRRSLFARAPISP
jgi:hypothetical protein